MSHEPPPNGRIANGGRLLPFSSCQRCVGGVLVIIRQRSSRLDPFLLHVVFPFFHSMGWAWALRLARSWSEAAAGVKRAEVRSGV